MLLFIGAHGDASAVITCFTLCNMQLSSKKVVLNQVLSHFLIVMCRLRKPSRVLGFLTHYKEEATASEPSLVQSRLSPDIKKQYCVFMF